MKALHDTINDRYIISTYFDKAAKTYITSVTDTKQPYYTTL